MGRATALAVLLLLALPASVAAQDSDGDGLRDFFERKWGITDPQQPDSDGDGLIDSMEDNDRDRLSNLGEQRFRTNPADRDSDGDGRTDGNEDSDRDGRSNAREQDRRPVPLGIRPSLAFASSNYPKRKETCHTDRRSSAVLTCTFGDESSGTTIALFGDSHAAQWIPALDSAGARVGWKVVQLTKSSCPSATLDVRIQRKLDGGKTCQAWRQGVLQWLSDHPPDVVLVSNLSRYDLVRPDGRRVRTADRPAVWERGLAATLAALPPSSRVVVLADTPRMLGNVIACLRKHRSNISACASRRPRALASDVRPAERRASRAAGATYLSLNDLVCSYDPCPLIHGKVLAWRDQGHLTAMFSRSLWPSMRDRLRSATEGELRPTRKRR